MGKARIAGDAKPASTGAPTEFSSCTVEEGSKANSALAVAGEKERAYRKEHSMPSPVTKDGEVYLEFPDKRLYPYAEGMMVWEKEKSERASADLVARTRTGRKNAEPGRTRGTGASTGAGTQYAIAAAGHKI